jgi:amino-acid N-acetyltransferase
VQDKPSQFVHWFRAASPYIHAHRGQTFVISFGGEAVMDEGFQGFIHDIALLDSLGIRLVLVAGIRPQIEQRLNERGIKVRYVNGLRVTDEEALICVKEAAGTVRIEIEALLSMGLANSPMASARIRVAAGNFVTAKPLGVRDGIDFRHTGEVRRVDSEAINTCLAQGDIVVISPLGYSPTGEVFDLEVHEVAVAVAESIRASKLIFMLEDQGIVDAEGELIRQLTQKEAQQLLNESDREQATRDLEYAVRACQNGVSRTHLIDRRTDGALLLELFSRDGIGTLISAAPFDHMRKATIEDVGGIIELVSPLEAEGVLVRRSREKLEMEIDQFTVLVRDGAIIGCAALYPHSSENIAELACLAVHSDYRDAGRGTELFSSLERQARLSGSRQLFVLTTQTAHWFLERGFVEGRIEDLPVARKDLYNYQRNSKVFVKALG